VALPELVHDGVNGFLVPPADSDAVAEAILRILEDSALARSMGQAGLAIAQAHSETRTFDLFEELYSSIQSSTTRR
jgi:glycosyltransferase involved in cell wall biosynthesis